MSGPLEIGQAVLSAQGKIFRKCARRYGFRLGFLLPAVVFLVFASIALHGVLWALFLELCHLGPLLSAVCVLGVDVLLAVIFLLCAWRTGRSGMAEERARAERDNRLREFEQSFKQSFALSTVLNIAGGPVGRYVGGRAWRTARSVFSRRKK